MIYIECTSCSIRMPSTNSAELSVVKCLWVHVHFKHCKHSYNLSAHAYIEPRIVLQVKNFEKTECHDERRKLAREIYDNFIMKEMLSHTHVRVYLLYCIILASSSSSSPRSSTSHRITSKMRSRSSSQCRRRLVIMPSSTSQHQFNLFKHAYGDAAADPHQLPLGRSRCRYAVYALCGLKSNHLFGKCMRVDTCTRHG